MPRRDEAVRRREQRAVSRWDPRRRWYYGIMAFVVIRTCRFIMRTMNSLEIENPEQFYALRDRGDRGLLTFSNHVSLFDDPLLLANLTLPSYDRIRWVAADALNFFGTPPTAFIFRAGKAVPIVRGAGIEQPAFHFLRDRLLEGAWVHIFPEGGRTRDPQQLMGHPFKPGIGWLMDRARPIALPFYHHGMQGVLPVGAKVPRRGKTVRLRFGDPIDCEELPRPGPDPESTHDLWRDLTQRSYDALASLQSEMNPAAHQWA